VLATVKSCINPDYPTDAKDTTPIGSLLTSLAKNFATLSDSAKNLFILVDDSVWIEVVSKNSNTTQQLRQALIGLGMTHIVDNGPGSLIITGQFPINNLLALNNLTDLLKEAYPLFPPVHQVGAVTTGGDTAMQSQLLKAGYGLSGKGITIGVLSDSYNKLLGADHDVSEGDLPPDVKLVKDLPYPGGTDEGRAMMQIIHDVAPDAKLMFAPPSKVVVILPMVYALLQIQELISS
jgi:hypothetical protein